MEIYKLTWKDATDVLPSDSQRCFTYNPSSMEKFRICLHTFRHNSQIGDYWEGQDNHFVANGNITHWCAVDNIIAPISKDNEQKAVELWNSGDWSSIEIASELGMTVDSVDKLINSLDWEDN